MPERIRDQESGRFISKLTPEVTTEVIKQLRSGVPPEMAAQAAGIWRGTYIDWMARGRRALAAANGNLEEILESDPHAAFAFEVEQALAQFVVGNMAVISTAGRVKTEGEWQALAWQLERRFPVMFARRTRHEVTGKDGGPIEHAIVLPPGAIDRLPLARKLLLAEILAELDGDIIDGEIEDETLALEA